jgi:hypothetical protein
LKNHSDPSVGWPTAAGDAGSGAAVKTMLAVAVTAAGVCGIVWGTSVVVVWLTFTAVADTDPSDPHTLHKTWWRSVHVATVSWLKTPWPSTSGESKMHAELVLPARSQAGACLAVTRAPTNSHSSVALRVAMVAPS